MQCTPLGSQLFKCEFYLLKQANTSSMAQIHIYIHAIRRHGLHNIIIGHNYCNCLHVHSGRMLLFITYVLYISMVIEANLS